MELDAPVLQAPKAPHGLIGFRAACEQIVVSVTKANEVTAAYSLREASLVVVLRWTST